MDVPHIHILLIEDDEDFRDLLSGLLTEEGYKVTSVSSGEEAVEKAAGESVDLVVADVKLGGMDGLDALSELRGTQPEFQSLVMTGYSTEADSIRAVKLGVGNYLKKPFTIKDFIRAVEDLAQKITEERQVREREQALLETVAWALQTVLASCPEVEDSADIGNRVRSAARYCGLDEMTSQQVALAVLATLVKRYAAVKELSFLLKGLPPAVTAILESGISLEHDLVKLGVALVESESVEVRSEVQEAYQQSQDMEAGTESLLPLGLALERSGDLEGADEVFARLCSDSKRRKEKLAGHLGRARVHFARGAVADAVKELESVTESETGSVLAAEAHLEKGVLLARMGRREPSVAELKTAASLFAKFGESLGKVRAELALAALGEQQESLDSHLRILLQPQNLEYFFQSAHWLFPFLLRTGSEQPEVRRGLRRFLSDLPDFCANWLRHSRSEESVIKALTVIQEDRLGGYDALVEVLAKSGGDRVRPVAESLLAAKGQVRRAPGLRILSLGQFEVFVGDKRVPRASWRGQKSTYVLSYLALRLGELVTRETLVDLFWPEAGDKGYRSLSQLLQVIKRALQPPDWPEQLQYIKREGHSLGLDTSVTCWHDAAEVDACLQRAAQLNEGEAAEELARAFELFRGPYLANCYMDWATEFRRRLDERMVDGGLQLAQTRLSQERSQEALEVTNTLLRLDPLCQQAYLRAMEAQLKLSRPEEALRLFEKCQHRLRVELEMEPSTDLIKAFHQAKLAL